MKFFWLLVMENPCGFYIFKKRLLFRARSQSATATQPCASLPGSPRGMPSCWGLILIRRAPRWGCTAAPTGLCCWILGCSRAVHPNLGHLWGPGFISPSNWSIWHILLLPAHLVSPCRYTSGLCSNLQCLQCWCCIACRALCVYVYADNHRGGRGSSRTCSLNFGFQTSRIFWVLKCSWHKLSAFGCGNNLFWSLQTVWWLCGASWVALEGEDLNGWGVTHRNPLGMAFFLMLLMSSAQKPQVC